MGSEYYRHRWDTCRVPELRKLERLRIARPDLWPKALKAQDKYARLEHLHEWATRTDNLAHENMLKLEPDRDLRPQLPQVAKHEIRNALAESAVDSMIGTFGRGGGYFSTFKQLLEVGQILLEGRSNQKFWNLPVNHPDRYKKSLSLTIGEEANDLATTMHRPPADLKLQLWNNFNDFKDAAENLCKYTDIERTLQPTYKPPLPYQTIKPTR